MATTERANKKQKGNKLHIKISALKSSTQFVNVEFEVAVFLQDDEGQMRTGYEDVPLKASLVYEDSPLTKVEPNILSVESSSIVNGRANLKCRLSDVSMNIGNRKVCLFLEPEKDTGNITPGKSSQGIYIIRHKIVMDTDQWENQWYKDEGGRDKAILLPLKLVDGAGQTIVNREVAVTVRLMYESGISVPNQGILKLHDASQTTIVNGVAELKVRIDEVSRNHQHQDFQIEVLPDPNQPLDQDVGGCISPSVTILSKRNRGGRSNTNPATTATNTTMGGGGMGGGAPPPQSMATVQGYHASLSAATKPLPILQPLPNPSGGSGVQGAMENLLSWINTVLVSMQAQSAVLKGLAQQNAQIESVLTTYQQRVMLDLQTIVNDLERAPQQIAQAQAQNQSQSQAQTQSHQSSHTATTTATSQSAEDTENSQPFPLDFGGMAGQVCPPRPEVGGEAPPPPSLPPPGLEGSNPASGLGDMPPPVGLSRGASAKLMRQVSALYFGEGTEEATLSTQLTYADLSPFSGDTDDIEKNVYYVVAKIFVTTSTKVGFPAFSASHQLLGFYRELEEESGTSVAEKLEFIPLSHAQAAGHLSEENVIASTRKLEIEIERRSKSVFTLATNNGNLDQLKTNVLFYFLDKRSVASRGGNGSSSTEASSNRLQRQPSAGSALVGEMEDLLRGSSELDPNWFFEL